MAQVTTGMRVVDAAGEEVGRVSAVTVGDPNAVTAQDPPGGTGVLTGRVPHTEDRDEPQVPPDIAAHLLRTGYLRIDASGPAADDLYVGADQIAEIAPATVALAVPRAALVPRG